LSLRKLASIMERRKAAEQQTAGTETGPDGAAGAAAVVAADQQNAYPAPNGWTPQQIPQYYPYPQMPAASPQMPPPVPYHYNNPHVNQGSSQLASQDYEGTGYIARSQPVPQYDVLKVLNRKFEVRNIEIPMIEVPSLFENGGGGSVAAEHPSFIQEPRKEQEAEDKQMLPKGFKIGWTNK
jgi:hypothetical protein